MATHKYPREKRKIVTINGMFDDFSDIPFSEATWEDTSETAYYTSDLLSEVVAAPGGAGGNALHLKGKVYDEVDTQYRTFKQFTSVAPYRNRSQNVYYGLNSWGKFGVQAEFRLYVVSDYEATSTDEKLAMSAGFCLDGNVMYGGISSTPSEDTAISVLARIMVNFNVASQKIGLCASPFDRDVYYPPFTLTEVAWTGSYATYYDIRIEWEFDWWNSPYVGGKVTVYVDNVAVITDYEVNLEDWRMAINASGIFNNNTYVPAFACDCSQLGRCGPQLSNGLATGGTAGLWVEAYYKDVLISQFPIKFVSAEFEDSLMERARPNFATFRLFSRLKASQFSTGSDIALHIRNKKTDDWGEPAWRGIIRDIDKGEGSIFTAEAESYFSLLTGEKTGDLTLTTKTTAQIIIEAINNPTKYEFNTTSFFDTVTDTYTRHFLFRPKLEVIEEAALLEEFLVFLDHGVNVHFQDPTTNELDKHLYWGTSRIAKVIKREIDFKRPNIIRVNGYEHTSYAESLTPANVTRNKITKVYSRPELVTQAECDDARDFYVALYEKDPEGFFLIMKPDWEIKKGYTITVTMPQHKVFAKKYLITGRSWNSNDNLMTVGLLEASPNVGNILANLSKSVDEQPSPSTAQDVIDADPWFRVRGTANVLVQAEFEIEYDSAIVRSGKCIVPDVHLELLCDLHGYNTPTAPTHIGIGTGTTTPVYSDTTLDTETGSRVAKTDAYAEKIAFAIDPAQATFYGYRAVEFSADFTNPSAITELGLFNASTVGDLFARATFASYTQTGTVTFRVKLRSVPVPGSVYVSLMLLIPIGRWWAGDFSGYTDTISNDIKMVHVGARDYVCPNPQVHQVPCVNWDVDQWKTAPILFGATPAGLTRGEVTINYHAHKVTFRTYSDTTWTYDFSNVEYIGFGVGIYSVTEDGYPSNLGVDGVPWNSAGWQGIAFNRDDIFMVDRDTLAERVDFAFSFKFIQGYLEDV